MRINTISRSYNFSFGAVKIKPSFLKNITQNTTRNLNQNDSFIRSTSINEVNDTVSKNIENEGFSQLAGYEDEKNALYKNFISEIEKAKQGKEANVPNAVLFFGPKGNGKTTFAKALTQEIGARRVSVYSGIGANSEEKFLNRLMTKANEAKELYERTGQLSVIFLDEILGVASKESSILPELKTFMQDCYNKYHCIVFATTTDPLKIQLPITGKNGLFSCVAAVNPPDLENKQAILKHYLSDILNDSVTDEDYKMLAEMLQQKEEETGNLYSNSKIEYCICKSPEYHNNEYFNNEISLSDIVKNINETEPDIRPDEMQKYKSELEKIMIPQPKGLQKVLGMDKLKAELVDSVIEPLTNPQYQEYGIDPIGGVLLYGPPGCGKTFIIKALAEELGRYFIEIKPSDVGSKFINETQINIKNKFEEAKKNAPSIVFIDEIEALAPSREDLSSISGGDETNKNVTELLMQFNDAKDNGIFIVCASNEPQRIDKAIKRTGRLDKKIFVPQPDVETRKAFLNDKLKRIKAEGVQVDIDLIAQNTEYYTAEDIKSLMQNASIKAIKEGIPLNTELVLEAIKEYKPDLNKYIVADYRRKGEY